MTRGGEMFGASHVRMTTLAATEDAAAAIGELSGRISGSFVRIAWERRAAWTGYTRALQLQGVEIDEIDVFCWANGVVLPDRPHRRTASDHFDAFGPWFRGLHKGGRGEWKDALPFTPVVTPGLPRLFRAIDLQHQYAQRSGDIDVWLTLPRFLHRLGMSHTPLPCLVGGSRSFRTRGGPAEDAIRETLRGIARSAQQGIDRLDAMERFHRDAILAIRSEYRPGKLPELLALVLTMGQLSPARVASELSVSIAGAGKLLDRAETLGLIVETSGRRTWKTYMAPDLAVALGFRRAPSGRPRSMEPLPISDTALSAVLEAFDREMAEIDARLSRTPSGGN
jgi:hypothetical protein